MSESLTEQLDVSVVVPVYDEEESLRELVGQVFAATDAENMTAEVIMVDDGSRDGSWSVIEKLAGDDRRVRGIRLKRNYGKSAALSTGFAAVNGRYVVTLDADLQDDPAEIPALIKLLEDGNDLVSGWKRKRNDPLSKTIPSRFFNFVTRLLSGIPLHDFNCGLKAYRAEVVKEVRLYGELHRYIPLLARYEGFDRIAEKPVVHHARKYGRTKFGIERYLRGFLDLLTVQFITRFASRPMHFFGSLGSLAFLGGFAISLYLSIEKLVMGNPIGDRPLILLGAILLLLGAQMFLTGLIGEMLIRERMQNRDVYGIAERTDYVGSTERSDRADFTTPA